MIKQEKEYKYYVTDSGETSVFEVVLKETEDRVLWEIYMGEKTLSSIDFNDSLLQEITLCMTTALHTFLKCFWWALRNKEFDFLNF